MTTPITPASPPELCPDCQRPKAHDTRATTAGCKMGLRGERGEPYRSKCHELTVARLGLEVARLNIALGKAQGEVEGLRAGWSISNHEAWEQGYIAGAADECDAGHIVTENPFPKPEKKESE